MMTAKIIPYRGHHYTDRIAAKMLLRDYEIERVEREYWKRVYREINKGKENERISTSTTGR
jgi:hypothetical protein